MTLTTVMGAALCAVAHPSEQFCDESVTLGASPYSMELPGVMISDSSLSRLLPETELIVRYGRRSQRWEAGLSSSDDFRVLLNMRWGLEEQAPVIQDAFVGVRPRATVDPHADTGEWDCLPFDCLDEIELSASQPEEVVR